MAAASQAIPLSTPPPPPEVQQQQNPQGAVSQFVSGYQPGADQQQQNPKELVKQVLTQVAEQLRTVARVLAVTDPASMPILKRMAEAGMMLMQNMGQDQQAAASGQPTMPQGPPEPGGPQGGQPEGANTPGM